MSFSLNVPPSVMAKMAKSGEGAEGAETAEGDAVTSSKKREDWKKLKELEEARKAGTAPAMQDEHGKDINPHIPQYIMQAPWYFGAMQPTLTHQRQQAEMLKSYSAMGAWYKKGVKEGTVATKYRKGACENCGALTHKKKDCLERPRKIGARFTGTEIAQDEYIQPDLEFDYESKRDRWNGYDVNEHKRIFEEYARIEEAKKELKSNQLDQSMQKERDEEEAGEKKVGDDDEDEDKYADDVDMPGQKFETKQRITVRNLRIREDTAKYLYNLDVNSAYYDPKTRSMRDNPFGKQGKDAAETKYGGDNFVRWSGDAHDMAEQQMFAWEAYEKGQDVHLQADPTKLQLLTKEYTDRKNQYKDNVKQSILDRYGGEKYLEAPPKQLLLAQSEDYVEYSRHGRVIKGQEKAIAKSRYEEDVYINNHKCVWGSYWSEGKWGYRCCHSSIKESYCTGDAGKSAQQVNLMEEENESNAVEDEIPEVPEIESPSKQGEKKDSGKKKKKREKKKRMKRKKKKKAESSSDSSESSSEEDEDAAKERKIQESMKKQEEKDKEMIRLMAMDERKRPYNVMYDLSAPSEEDMEAYRRKRIREEDPMAQFLS